MKVKISREEFNQLKQDMKSNGELVFTIASNSMSPIIKKDDPIVVVECKTPPSPSDIIVFLKYEILICHYVQSRELVRGTDNVYLFHTRGLNTDKKDAPVNDEQILGLVVSHKLSLQRRLFHKVLHLVGKS